MDCYKDDPRKMKYLQMNPKKFVRIHTFLESCQNREIEPSDHRRFNRVREGKRKLEEVINLFEVETGDAVKNIKKIFFEIEENFVKTVKKNIKDIEECVLSDFVSKWDLVKNRVRDVWKESTDILKFTDNGHLNDLQSVLEGFRRSPSKKNYQDLTEKIDKMVEIHCDLDALIHKWSGKMQRFLEKDAEKRLLPNLDFSNVKSIFREKQEQVAAALQNILQENSDYRRFGVEDMNLTNRTKKGMHTGFSVLNSFYDFESSIKDPFPEESSRVPRDNPLQTFERDLIQNRLKQQKRFENNTSTFYQEILKKQRSSSPGTSPRLPRYANAPGMETSSALRDQSPPKLDEQAFCLKPQINTVYQYSMDTGLKGSINDSVESWGAGGVQNLNNLLRDEEVTIKGRKREKVRMEDMGLRMGRRELGQRGKLVGSFEEDQKKIENIFGFANLEGRFGASSPGSGRGRKLGSVEDGLDAEEVGGRSPGEIIQYLDTGIVQNTNESSGGGGFKERDGRGGGGGGSGGLGSPDVAGLKIGISPFDQSVGDSAAFGGLDKLSR